MYGIPIAAVLVVLPTERITSLRGLVDAMKTVFTVYGGRVAADGSVTLAGAGLWLGRGVGVLFIWVLVASGSAWIMGAGRAQAAACLEGAGPRVLGRISARSGVPVVIALASGGVSLAAMSVDLWATGGDGQKYFSGQRLQFELLVLVPIAAVVVAWMAYQLAVRREGAVESGPPPV